MRIQDAIEMVVDLRKMVKKRTLRWYGHIWRSSGMAENNSARDSEKEQEGEEDRIRDSNTT